MAAIEHFFVEQNTQQTTTSTTYADVSGASIASGNFTAGKKYLLYITAQLNCTPANAARLRVRHGTTNFAESEGWARLNKATYAWFAVWTAVAGEAITLQMRTNISPNTSQVDQIAMFAMNLSDDLTEDTDWFFNERSTDDALSTTFLDGGSVTFTPGTASQDWLVLSFTQDSSTTPSVSKITRISESVGATVLPQGVYSVVNPVNEPVSVLARVFSLSAAAHTIKEQSATVSGTAWTRLHSKVFVLNLNKFSVHANAYTEADLSLSATDYATNIQTISITPTVTSDVWIGAYWGFDLMNVARTAKFRVQIDSADQPAGQTTDAYTFAIGPPLVGDENPFVLTTMPSLTTGAKTINLDASVDSTTGTPAAQERTLWAVTMELRVNFTQSVAGTLTSSGALTKKVGKALFGDALGLAGALTRQVGKSLAGTLASDGAPTKEVHDSLSGVLTTAGAPFKAVGKGLSGMLDVAGTLTKMIAFSLSGALVSVGELTKTNQILMSLSGSLDSAGSVVKNVGKGVEGFLDDIGNLTNQILMSLSGSLDSAGSVVKNVGKTLDGIIAFTGSINAVTGRVVLLMSTLTFGGSLTKHVGKGLSRLLTFSGETVKQIGKNLAGVVDFTGTLITNIGHAVLLTSTLTFDGSLTKQIGKSLSALLSLSGEIAKNIRTNLSALLTFSGNLIKQISKLVSGSLGGIIAALTGAVAKHKLLTTAVFMSTTHRSTLLLKDSIKKILTLGRKR